MGLPPPLLQDLALMVKTSNSKKCEKVWEIGVPSGNSLYWSLILSYLLSSDDHRFSTFIDELKSDGNTGRKKKSKILPSDVNFRDVKKRLRHFNPFKNRYVLFFESVYIKILNAFKLKLYQFAYEISKNIDWNDEVKLNAAINMLNCNIHVYFPEEKKMISYQNKNSKNIPTIVLFQYRDQKHGSRKENINVFRFAMSIEHANPLKLCALAYILKKAKLSLEDTRSVQLYMYDEKAHGENFLPIILQSPQYYILPSLYKSTYIAIKLSQAGFETNPTVVHSDKPTSFLFASTKADTKYIRILYDYAANCRYLFENTMRDPNETVLSSLKILHDVFANDISKIHQTNYQTELKERLFHILNDFFRFNEYQQSVVAAILKLKNEPLNQDVLCIRKKYVQRIIENYQEYFYFDSPKSDICEMYSNYLTFDEYYENIDSFSCVSFLDFIHKLKKVFQLKENIYAPIESTFFLLVVSNKHFPKFKHDVECASGHCKESCEIDKNLLRFIPLLYREVLKQKMNDFLRTCSHHVTSPVPQEKIKDEHFRGSLSSFPEIVDELLIYRIRIYLTAAVDISFNEDGIKGILVVERALQILGESIKPQSTVGCVVSCLLGSRLPQKIKKELMKIRNDMSHYRDNSSEGRLTIEKDSQYFSNLQKEIVAIRKRFEIVAFTQYLRVEESLIKNCKEEMAKQILEKSINLKFHEACTKRLDGGKQNYKNYNKDCVELSLDVIRDFLEYANCNGLVNCKQIRFGIKSTVDSSLRCIEYIFTFMCRNINEKIFQPYLEEIQRYCQKYKSDKKIASLIWDMHCFLEKYKDKIKHFEILDTPTSSFQLSTLESFFKSLKQSNITASDIKVIVQAVKDAYIEATKAKEELITNIEMGCIGLGKTEEGLLRKLILSKKSLEKLESDLKEKDKKMALIELGKKWTPSESMEEKMKKMLEDNSIEDLAEKTLLIKFVYQRHLQSNIYTSVKLKNDICDKFEKFLMKKVDFLLSRIDSMKSVLIDDDDEIAELWKWGRSVEIKHHMKFLMRQRFLREMAVRSSLEMAFFDCLNILHRGEFSEMYEKVNNLYAGINLRHVLSHGDNVLETIGGLLDEDDLPSELINKMLELIDDSEAIITMRNLISLSDTLEAEGFKSWIKEKEGEEVFENLIKKITRCSRWEKYLFLLPLI